MKSLTKGLSALVLLLVLLVGAAAPALAWTTLPTVEIEVNGIDVDSHSTDLDVERGDELDIEFKITADGGEDLKDLEIVAKLENGEDDVVESTGLFDVSEGRIKTKTLTIVVPEDFEEDEGLLKVVLEDGEGVDDEYTFNLFVSGKRHDIAIDRVVMTPSSVVKAGSYLTLKAKVENYGERDEDDVVVKAEIVGLEGTSDSEMIEDGDLNAGDYEYTEELYLAVPLCAEAGEYQVKVSVLYNNDKEETVEYLPITVVESGSSLCAAKEVVAPKVTMPEAALTVNAGESLVLPVTVSNPTSEAKNYVVSLTVGDWGALRFVPGNTVTVAAGSTETLYVYVDTNADAAGEKVLGLTVKAGEEVVKEATLKANVNGSESLNLNTLGVRKVLEIGLVVLIVLIVLVGLIIGFNKLKDDDDDFEEDDKSYY